MGGGAMGGMGGTMGGMGGMTGEAMPESAEAMDGAVPMEPRNRRLREAEKRAAGRMFDDRDTDSPLPFFEQLDSTKQWAESHWDRVGVTDSGPDLIAVDPFWLDVASATDSSAMPSEHLLRPSGNRHAAIVALAFCGLPLSGDDVKLPADEAPFAPPHAVAVITKRLSELRPEADEPSQSGSILVGQRFERVIPDGRPVPRAKAVAVAPDEFLVGAPYRGQIILTNPTPTERTIDVLWQIPAGSVAIAGGQATDSRTITLAPFLVEKIDYEFYFPLPGDFVHYPVCVATDGVVAARAVERVFNVLAVPSRVDEKSWQSIAESGTAAQIDTFLQTENLRETDWNLVLHRLTDREIYEVISKVFDENKLENELVRGYSLHHRDPQGIKEFLSTRENLVGSVGPVLRSDLLTVDPIERRLHEHLEYAPLVVARIHPLREQNEILNPTFLDHYRDVMRVIAYSGEPNDTQRLVLVYHFLLQNRIEEAIEAFATVDAEKIETRLQYSYLAACLALHRGDLATAEKIAFDSSGHPVPRWKARFETLAEQLRQHRRWGGEAGQIKGSEGEAVRGDSGDLALIDRERRGGQAAENEPSVEVSIDGRTVRIAHRNAATAVLNLYAVDPELLFSKTPFVRDDLAGMAMVQATRTQTVELSGVAESKGNRGVTTVLLDENLARQTLMVEIVAGPARATTLYYGGNLAAYVSEGFGQVQVTDMTTAAAVSTAYVKVYARHQDGQIKFYKDGYTDLRGRFDYASISTGDLATVERFAILVIDPERGATIREANRP